MVITHIWKIGVPICTKWISHYISSNTSATEQNTGSKRTDFFSPCLLGCDAM